MEDLIERARAIEIIHELQDSQTFDQTADMAYDLVDWAISEIPSTQPETHEERTETHACDLISRQAAIDAFDNLEWFHQNANKDMVSGANPEHHQAWYKEQDVYKTLEQLPSAQPEIVRCKDCRNRGDDDCPMRFIEWVEYDDDGYIEHDDIIHDYTKDDGFCDRAERRTDET